MATSSPVVAGSASRSAAHLDCRTSLALAAILRKLDASALLDVLGETEES